VKRNCTETLVGGGEKKGSDLCKRGVWEYRSSQTKGKSAAQIFLEKSRRRKSSNWGGNSNMSIFALSGGPVWGGKSSLRGFVADCL